MPTPSPSPVEGTASSNQAHASQGRAARVLPLLLRHGWNPTSPQVLDGDYRFWFTDDAVVAYVDTGTALVVAGAPICPLSALPAVTASFTTAAARRGRATVFFGVHERFLTCTKLPAIPIGETLFWRPQAWPTVLARAPSLRAQLRRAASRGVRVERVEPHQERLLQPELQILRARWLARQGMASMSFLAQPSPLRTPSLPGRVLFVAWQGARPVGYLRLSPIYARQGVLLQDWIRSPTAPNGTTELLLDGAFRHAAAEGLQYATLGLSPLEGCLPLWLRAARRVGRPCFDFEGLCAFKAKLRPHGRESAAVAGVGASPAALVVESLRAFAGGSLLGFGAATLRKRLAPRAPPTPLLAGAVNESA